MSPRSIPSAKGLALACVLALGPACGPVEYINQVTRRASYEVAAAKGRKLACVSRAVVDEMKSKTVMQIIQEVDRYYQDNPEKVGTPVIEVVLGQMVKAPAAGVSPGKAKQ